MIATRIAGVGWWVRVGRRAGYGVTLAEAVLACGIGAPRVGRA